MPSGSSGTVSIAIVYYAPRGRKRTLLTSVSFQYESRVSAHESQVSSENTRVDKVPLPRSTYATFYNTRVISDVFWYCQIFWGS